MTFPDLLKSAVIFIAAGLCALKICPCDGKDCPKPRPVQPAPSNPEPAPKTPH